MTSFYGVLTLEHLFHTIEVTTGRCGAGNVCEGGLEQDVTRRYLTLKQASAVSGLHVNTLSRLVRTGKLEGHKATVGGVRCWYITAESLRQYTDPLRGYLLELPGPKLFLRRVKDKNKRDTGRS